MSERLAATRRVPRPRLFARCLRPGCSCGEGGWPTEFLLVFASRNLRRRDEIFQNRQSFANEGGLPLRGWFMQGWAPLFAFFFLRLLRSIHRIDANQSALIVGVEGEAAQGPILGMPHQAFLHWIGVHVVEFFFLLGMTPDIEIVEAPLPKAPIQRQGISEIER